MIKEAVERNKGLFTILAASITLVGSIAGSAIAYVGSMNQANADLVASLLQDKQLLEERDIELRAELLKLQLEVKQKYESSDVVKGVLDAMPFPAWVKMVFHEDGEIVFRMWHINTEYEQSHNVSNKFYSNYPSGPGRTDYDVWDEAVADQFYKNDMFVFNRMSHRCKPEEYPLDSSRSISPSNPVVPGFVCKFTATIENKIAIVGMAIKSEPQKPQRSVR